MIILHVSTSTLLRVSRCNVMMDMRMYNVSATRLLVISSLVVNLDPRLLAVLSVVVALLILIGLPIDVNLSILPRLKSTEK